MNNKYFNITTGSLSPSILYQRPKATLQSISYRTGDAGWHKANGTYNWPTPVVGNLIRQQLDFTQPISTFGRVLLYNNAFGNKIRFTGINGGYTNDGVTFFNFDNTLTTQVLSFPDSIIIDNLTGLGWFRPDTLARPWNNTIDNIHNINWYGYTDWRTPTLDEVFSMTIYDNGILKAPVRAMNYTPLNPIAYHDQVYTSNTSQNDTNNAFWFAFYSENRMLTTPKTSSVRQYYCRTWF